jgi:hypothetical protein
VGRAEELFVDLQDRMVSNGKAEVLVESFVNLRF